MYRRLNNTDLGWVLALDEVNIVYTKICVIKRVVLLIGTSKGKHGYFRRLTRFTHLCPAISYLYSSYLNLTTVKYPFYCTVHSSLELKSSSMHCITVYSSQYSFRSNNFNFT